MHNSRAQQASMRTLPGIETNRPGPEASRAVISRPVTQGSQDMFTLGVIDRLLQSVDVCPWPTLAARSGQPRESARTAPLYTPEERQRRDQSRWTLVQGVLAPVQFLIFLVSLGLVLNCLWTGTGTEAAITSVVVKTMALYTIMITGAIWERDVFGVYLFAPAFYWEDMVSMLVIALHTAYLVALLTDALATRELMVLALAAYATYVVNAAQFVLKLRAARREQAPQAWRGTDSRFQGLAQ
jgi:3-vinyl bacteriochlorophyllide hydratase